MNLTNIDTCRNFINHLNDELNNSVNENIKCNNIIKIKDHELNIVKKSINSKEYDIIKNNSNYYKQKLEINNLKFLLDNNEMRKKISHLNNKNDEKENLRN